MANKDNTCEVCGVDNWDENDNFCAMCREKYGPDAETSDLTGPNAGIDIGLKGIRRDIYKVAPGWKEAMGVPIVCDIDVPAIPKHKSPGIHIHVEVTFVDPERKDSAVRYFEWPT